jgi:hypothetical protein
VKIKKRKFNVEALKLPDICIGTLTSPWMRAPMGGGINMGVA